MIRFIIKIERCDFNGPKMDHLYTIDINVPELEAALDRGGSNPSVGSYEYHSLVGVELLRENNP